MTLNAPTMLLQVTTSRQHIWLGGSFAKASVDAQRQIYYGF